MKTEWLETSDKLDKARKNKKSGKTRTECSKQSRVTQRKKKSPETRSKESRKTRMKGTTSQERLLGTNERTKKDIFKKCNRPK